MKLTKDEAAAALSAKVRRGKQERGEADPSPENQIKLFFQCRKCVEELAQMGGPVQGESPQSYARVSVGWTQLGFQVWCNRHEVNVLHLDLEGFQHPANTSRSGEDPIKH